MGKGSQRRPMLVSEEEYSLRWNLAWRLITPAKYKKKIKTIRKIRKR